MWSHYSQPATLEAALGLLGQKPESARIVAGATDLILELERGVRKGVEHLIDITRIPGLDRITTDASGVVHLGPLVTHGQVATSQLLQAVAFPLVRASWEVGAPQIRNRGTVAGNLITASPANDTISPLMALDASVVLQSHSGKRAVRLVDFYIGVRKTVMRPDEILTEIFFQGMPKDARGTFIKLALRRAQAISVVDIAAILHFEGPRISKASITLGAVTPTIIHAAQAEQALVGKELTAESIRDAGRLAAQASSPIDDVRASAAYRKRMVAVLVERGLRTLRDGTERRGFPSRPVELASTRATTTSHPVGEVGVIRTAINGKPYEFTTGHQKTLLRLLREDAGLIGTKEGCAEGECGACTVFLDGKAVMACLVPAPRADGADITTVEGVGSQDKPHAVQQAFIDKGAVQCGYCTPGFVMSSVMLLDEAPNPTRDQITEALTGNLCRCTGYYKIIEAVEQASHVE